MAVALVRMRSITSARSGSPGRSSRPSSVVAEQCAVLAEDLEQARPAQDLVEAGGALDRGDLAHERLCVLRGGDAVRDQAFAGGGQVAHLDGGAERAEQQRQRDRREAEQDQAAERARAQGGEAEAIHARMGTLSGEGTFSCPESVPNCDLTGGRH